MFESLLFVLLFMAGFFGITALFILFLVNLRKD
jgi:hypothetical protein